MKFINYVILTSSIFCLIGCCNSFEKQIRDKGYEPLQHPQDGRGPGTIINFLDNGQLVTVRFQSNTEVPDQKDCIPSNKVRIRDYKAPNYNFEDALEFELGGEATFLKLPLGAKINGKIVHKVILKLSNVSAEELEGGTLREWVNGDKITKECREDITNNKNLIIVRAFKAKFEYTLLDNKNVKINIDAESIKNIIKDLKTDLVIKENSKYTMESKEPLYLGMVAARWKDLSGGLGTSGRPRFVLRELTQKELQARSQAVK